MAAEIRPANLTDVDALSAIENSVFTTDRISRRSFRRLLRSRSAVVLVAVEDEEVAGYLVLLFRAGSSRARLYSIATVPGWRGRGLGQALLTAAEAQARHRDAAILGLEVREDNLRAVRLYEKNGYLRSGTIAHYYGDGAAAFRYRKALPEGSAAGTERQEGR